MYYVHVHEYQKSASGLYDRLISNWIVRHASQIIFCVTVRQEQNTQAIEN